MRRNLDLEKWVTAKNQGKTPEEVVLPMKEEGLTIMESMKAIMDVYGVSLGEAKRICTQHPAWQRVVDSHQAFHDELEQALNNDCDCGD